MKNLKIKPFKNDIGALVETDLNSASLETINLVKKVLNNFYFTYIFISQLWYVGNSVLMSSSNVFCMVI